MTLKSDLVVFSDFDGTFTAKDIGNRIYTHFSGGRNRQLVEDWKKGLITSRECLTRESELITATADDIKAFLNQFELSPGALETYKELTHHGIPFYILSDGLDFYIDYILRKFHLEQIPHRANRAIFDRNRLRIEFPYRNDGCPRCGSCKGVRIKEIVGAAREEVEVVFIGDGLSDICALPQSDTIFARGDLLTYCRQHQFPAIEYSDFFDILNWFKETAKITD